MGRLDLVAVGADRLGLVPCSHAVAKDFEAVLFDEPTFGLLHGSFPLLLPLGLFA